MRTEGKHKSHTAEARKRQRSHEINHSGAYRMRHALRVRRNGGWLSTLRRARGSCFRCLWHGGWVGVAVAHAQSRTRAHPKKTPFRAMKLHTHNILTSNVKGVKRGYPLLLRVAEVRPSTFAHIGAAQHTLWCRPRALSWRPRSSSIPSSSPTSCRGSSGTFSWGS